MRAEIRPDRRLIDILVDVLFAEPVTQFVIDAANGVAGVVAAIANKDAASIQNAPAASR